MFRTGYIFILLFLAGQLAALRGQDAKQIVQRAVQTELTADQNDHSHWLYCETDRKQKRTVKQWVAETQTADLQRVTEKNGHVLSPAEQRKLMDSFVYDSGAQAKQRKAAQQDDRQATELLRLLPDAFLWSNAGKQGGNIVLHFKPNPQFHAPDIEARVFAAMEGNLAVDPTQYRIASLKGQLIHDVKIGGGLFGDLKTGGSFDVERREIGKGKWQITETHVHIYGHALLFKSISEQEDDIKTEFKELPQAITLQQAEGKLLEKGTP